MIFLGVNTGTSADAVDCAAFEISQDTHQFIDAVSIEMPKKVKQGIFRLVESSSVTVDESAKLNHQLTEVYIEAIWWLLKKNQWRSEQIRAIGLHGQTIHHRPDIGYPYTMQLGSACMVASQLGIEVVDRFREVDISLGGQGAPLIPAYHRYLLRGSRYNKGVFLNLGGIANATVISGEKVIGWDIGPANALMDLWAQDKFGVAYDQEGQIARSGKPIQDVLDEWLKDEYFKKAYPKSTGRDYFSGEMLDKMNLKKLSPADVMATCCELTAQSVSNDLKKYADKEAREGLFLYGKGVANEFLLERFAKLMPAYEVRSCDELGVSAEWLEAGLFAWLSYCFTQKIAVDLTSVTGAKNPAILGSSVMGV